MSFVIFAGCKYFGIMLGDKRCIDPDNNIIDENVTKVKKLTITLFHVLPEVNRLLTAYRITYIL